MYIMIWHLKFLNLKNILRPSIVGGMPLKRTHVVPSLNIECTPRVWYLEFDYIYCCYHPILLNTNFQFFDN